jgi:16S rRNA G966 N2-methylase RsmD
MPENLLYYGDNLDILRRYVQDESVDLIYLDPPFKSNQDYNVLFAERDGSRAAAQTVFSLPLKSQLNLCAVKSPQLGCITRLTGAGIIRAYKS